MRGKSGSIARYVYRYSGMAVMECPEFKSGTGILGSLQALGTWRHRRRWARKNIHRLHNADVVLVSHTKSGRTWLRVMISYLYHLKYGTPATEIIGYDNLHELNPAIPRIYFTRDTCVPTFSRDRGSVHIANDKRVIFLVRDPRDVAVSFYFHVCNRASDRELNRKGISPHAKTLSLFDFVMDDNLGVPRVIRHFNRWCDEMKDMPHTIVVKYEQVRADAVDVLGRVMQFIDGGFEQDDLLRAVEFASFDSLSRKEVNGFFHSGRLRPANPRDTGSFKVRRGKVGGYRDYFSPEQIETIDQLVRENLDPSYEYA